jgi:hypothetical protein
VIGGALRIIRAPQIECRAHAKDSHAQLLPESPSPSTRAFHSITDHDQPVQLSIHDNRHARAVSADSPTSRTSGARRSVPLQRERVDVQDGSVRPSPAPGSRNHAPAGGSGCGGARSGSGPREPRRVGRLRTPRRSEVLERGSPARGGCCPRSRRPKTKSSTYPA